MNKAEYLVGLMLDGKILPALQMQGTPGISDPGEVLVQKCYEAGIKVTISSRPCCMYNRTYYVWFIYKKICI